MANHIVNAGANSVQAVAPRLWNVRNENSRVFSKDRVLVDSIEKNVWSETGRLKTVVVSPPSKLALRSINADASQRKKTGERVFPLMAVRQHEDMCDVLDKHGVKLVWTLPSEESVFTRDIGVVVGSEFYRASMKAKVRRPEMGSISGGKAFLPDGVYLEGGDVFVYRGEVFVGLGERTKLRAVTALQKALPSWRVRAIRLRHDKSQSTLHLDCACTVLGHDRFLVCPDMFANPEDVIYFQQLFRNGFILVPVKEAKAMATNLLHLDPETILTIKNPEGGSFQTTITLRRFYNVIEIDYSEMAKATGSVRCSTLPLNREG